MFLLKFYLPFSALIIIKETLSHLPSTCVAKYRLTGLDRIGSRGGAIAPIGPPITYESSLFHHDLNDSEEHSRYKAIFPSTVFSRQCREISFMSFTALNPLWDLTAKYY